MTETPNTWNIYYYVYFEQQDVLHNKKIMNERRSKQKQVLDM